MYIKYYTDTEQCLAHNMKCFMHQGLFNAHNNPAKWVLLPLFYTRKLKHREGSNLSKVHS